MKFFVNKYPLKNAILAKNDGDTSRDIPEGNVFTISGINGNGFELKPVQAIGECFVIVDAQMLKVGFTETNYIPNLETRPHE